METTQISTPGKVIAGILLIGFSFSAVLSLIAFWPDRLPDVNGKSNRYKYKLFDMTLIADSTQAGVAAVTGGSSNEHTVKDSSGQKDTITDPDSVTGRSASQMMGIQTFAAIKAPRSSSDEQKKRSIHLNTLLLILVASAGFLGAMVHIGASFTNFVGSGEFKKSWLLWYFVKPFTGAGVAVIFYFVFRAGLLNVNDNGGAINIYGIISLAALSGLFTDKATLKLEEIFAVMFKPKDDRPGKMQEFQIQEITPEALLSEGENVIVIRGKSLKKGNVSIKMEDETISNPSVTDDTITFTYTIPPSKKAQAVIRMTITDAQNKEHQNDFVVQTVAPSSPPQSPGF